MVLCVLVLIDDTKVVAGQDDAANGEEVSLAD